LDNAKFHHVTETTTRYVLDTTIRKQNTNNVNKISALLQTRRRGKPLSMLLQKGEKKRGVTGKLKQAAKK
jgi:hypothetical protein